MPRSEREPVTRRELPSPPSQDDKHATQQIEAAARLAESEADATVNRAIEAVRIEHLLGELTKVATRSRRPLDSNSIIAAWVRSEWFMAACILRDLHRVGAIDIDQFLDTDPPRQGWSAVHVLFAAFVRALPDLRVRDITQVPPFPAKIVTTTTAGVTAALRRMAQFADEPELYFEWLADRARGLRTNTVGSCEIVDAETDQSGSSDGDSHGDGRSALQIAESKTPPVAPDFADRDAHPEKVVTGSVDADQRVFSLRRHPLGWNVVYEGRAFSIRDLDGMTYIAHLVDHAGQPVPVEQLEEIAGKVRVKSASADARMDPQALKACDARMGELSQLLKDSDAALDPEQREALEADLAAIRQRVDADTNPQGRGRWMGSTSEEARNRVGKCMAAALEAIAEQDPPTAKYLRATLESPHGLKPVYRPELAAHSVADHARAVGTGPRAIDYRTGRAELPNR